MNPYETPKFPRTENPDTLADHRLRNWIDAAFAVMNLGMPLALLGVPLMLVRLPLGLAVLVGGSCASVLALVTLVFLHAYQAWRKGRRNH